jgi:membrane protein
MKTISLVGRSLKEAFGGFSEHKITKLSASLSYYTVFSLGPLLILIISLCSIFLGREAIEGTIFNQLQSFIGKDAAAQIQEIIKNASINGKGGIAAVIGVITLLIGATTVFGEMQDSMNGIWGLKPRPKSGWLKLVKDRILSFGLIATLGFLLLVSLGVTAIMEALSNRLKAALPDVTVVLFYILNLLLTLVVITILFSVIFKVLPDAKIRWKDILPGAIATAILFMIGKFGISFYISKSNVGTTFGAAGSLVILLVWVYYSSIILYFGAEFTRVFALKRGARIVPSEYAEWNKEPVVAGAETKHKGPQDRTAERNQKQNKQIPGAPSAPMPPAPRFSFSSAKEEKNKKAGMGTVLLALVLYAVRGK